MNLLQSNLQFCVLTQCCVLELEQQTSKETSLPTMVCWNSGNIYSKQLHSWQFILFQGCFSLSKTARKINYYFNGPWLQSPVMRPIRCQGHFKSFLPLIPVFRDCLQQLSCSFPVTKCNTDVGGNTVVTWQQLKASGMRITQLQILPSKGTELEIVAKFIICIIVLLSIPTICLSYTLQICPSHQRDSSPMGLLSVMKPGISMLIPRSREG